MKVPGVVIAGVSTRLVSPKPEGKQFTPFQSHTLEVAVEGSREVISVETDHPESVATLKAGDRAVFDLRHEGGRYCRWKLQGAPTLLSEQMAQAG